MLKPSSVSPLRICQSLYSLSQHTETLLHSEKNQEKSEPSLSQIHTRNMGMREGHEDLPVTTLLVANSNSSDESHVLQNEGLQFIAFSFPFPLYLYLSIYLWDWEPPLTQKPFLLEITKSLDFFFLGIFGEPNLIPDRCNFPWEYLSPYTVKSLLIGMLDYSIGPFLHWNKQTIIILCLLLQ